MDQDALISEEPTSDASATTGPEWRYVPIRRTSLNDDDGDSQVAMEELVLQTEGATDGDIAGNFKDTAEGDALVFSDLGTDGGTTSRYDDDGDLDLYVVNTPGGDNAMTDESLPKLQETVMMGRPVPAADDGLDMTDSFDIA